ncbi:MAG: hypothetical protein ACI8PB_001708 [Desulforhopalus sp.]|jgi:hypothetical protein
MKTLNQIISMTIIFLFMIIDPAFAKGLSEQSSTDNNGKENMQRTNLLITQVEDYLRKNDAYVGIIARRGSGDPKTGVSDVDNLDLSGMAHCGFVVRNGFGKNSSYITFNLVRMKGAKTVEGKDYDLSQLRAWTLPHFFIGSFEKDAIIFLPEKKIQLKLWNLLRANGQLKIDQRKRYLTDNSGKHQLDNNGQKKFVTDQIISNGAFPVFHNSEYNLLSDFVNESTQNCNEHLLKTYVGFRDYWKPTLPGYSLTHSNDSSMKKMLETTTKSIKENYTPRQMVLSRTKSTFAFTQNIRFGERYEKSPTFFGFKLNKEKFEVVSVDSFCDPKNQLFLTWADFKVFREDYSKAKGWFIHDNGKDYVKINRISNKKNVIM